MGPALSHEDFRTGRPFDHAWLASLRRPNDVPLNTLLFPGKMGAGRDAILDFTPAKGHEANAEMIEPGSLSAGFGVFTYYSVGESWLNHAGIVVRQPLALERGQKLI